MTPRKQAASNGQTVYSAGEPCKRGHLAPRYVVNGGCTECMRLGRALTAPFKFANLHADDHAEARAFCQMLQARRGQHVEM